MKQTRYQLDGGRLARTCIVSCRGCTSLEVSRIPFDISESLQSLYSVEVFLLLFVAFVPEFEPFSATTE